MSELFLTIFNTAVTAGWLVLAVLVARLLLKHAPGWAKCALWAIVGLRLIWPFELESILSLVPSAQTLPTAELYDYTPEIHTGIYAVNSTINPVFTQTFLSGPQNSVNPLQVAVFIASVVWVIGMIVMAGYALISYLRLRHRVSVSIPAGEGVYLCDTISSPFILGLMKPKIYLPSDLPQEQWDAILSHERAHLARRDHWWKPLGFALLTVFWFHPLLWFAYVLLCRDVELACDEKVIQSLSPEEKQVYSQTLLECSLPRKWITACPLAFGETSVKARIKAVLHYKKPTLWIIIAALVICSVLAVCFLTNPQSNLTGAVYQVEEQVFRPSLMSYDPHLSGHFRVTGEDILQYDYETRYSGVEPGWCDVGRLEKMTLTKENFDEALLVHVTLDEKQPMLEQIRRNNKNAWRVIPTEESSMWDGIFLEQKNGELYYLVSGCFLYRLSERPAYEAAANFFDKQYVYTKPGAGSAFYINIYSDGTFQYYAGVYSSHIGLGDWELKDGKLYLYDTTLTSPMTFVFSVTEDALAYIAAESHPFMYVDVSDGERFRYYMEISKPERHVVWLTLERTADFSSFYALDSEGNRWHVLLDDDIGMQTSIPLDGIWVSFYGTPKELSDVDVTGVRYEITAHKWWRHVEDETLTSRENVIGWVYDYCLYDVDNDGDVEECIISTGHTSGFFTIHYSVWQDGKCEEEKLLYTNFADGFAFDTDENGLFILSSEGNRIYPGLYSNGIRQRDILTRKMGTR